MPDLAAPSRLRTGFASLDQVEARRVPRSLTGVKVLSDPCGVPGFSRMVSWDQERPAYVEFREIERAYNVDSYFRQGVDKYGELTYIRGWEYGCESDDPINFLKKRFLLMGIMTRKPFACLVADLLLDFIKYANAYWVKKRGRLGEPVDGIPERGVNNLQPILGYFRADPKRMHPIWSADRKRIERYEYTHPLGHMVIFPADDVIHFVNYVQAGGWIGSSHLGPVLADTRTYRQCEDYVIKLVYKHLNPLLHHEVPEKTDGFGAPQGDIDAAAWSHAFMAPDGMIVTPPGHKINMIGAESRALRGEGYMNLLKMRLFAGLGVSQLAMGEGETVTAGSADAQTAAMHNKAHYIQEVLAEQITEFVLYELLQEGGFDPTTPLDTVTWEWNDFEIETRIKIENNAAQLFGTDGITRTEMRRILRRRPMTPDQELDTHVQKVLIPQVEAAGEARAGTMLPPGNGPQKQVAAKNKPSNQHGTRSGPKVRPR